MTLTNFTNSYVISSRTSVSATSYADITPLPSGQLWWLSAANPAGSSSNPTATDFDPASGVTASSTPPADFLAALKADLAIAAGNGFPQLTVVIHGLSTLFDTAIAQTAGLIDGFRSSPSVYGGLLMVFDWPSYDAFDSMDKYSPTPWTFPVPAVAGTIRGNIACTVPAFTNFMTFLQGLSSQYKINFICHSEGNYMMNLGINAQPASAKGFLNQVLMAAADINNGAFQPNTGQGLCVANQSQQVTIYYSSGDDLLPLSEGLTNHHNPTYPARLGFEGPASLAEMPQNLVAVDCATVVNETVLEQYQGISSDSHSLYYYVPQIHQDWSQTLMGADASSVVNRTGDGNFLAMNYVAPATISQGTS